MATTNFGQWTEVAGRHDLDGVMKSIVTGRTVSESAADEWLAGFVDAVPEGGCVLDFGCGVGRNLTPAARLRPDVTFVGYDSPQMAARLEEYSLAKYGEPLPANIIAIAAPNWPDVCERKFDLTFASLVFQHVTADEISVYLADIKRITDTIVIHGRRANDHSTKTTWELIEECGMHPDNADSVGYSPRGHSEEHHLCIYRIK